MSSVSPDENVLEVNSLRKAYNGTVAVDNISFKVAAGEIVGLLGPNGAGKTTTINMILGLLEPQAGTIFINGIDAYFNRSRVMGFTNFAAAYTPLPGNLTVYQNLHIFSMLYGIKDFKRRSSEIIGRFNLKELSNVKCGVLSSGEQTRVSLAKAMLNDPGLLLLDEPTASLDPAAGRDIRAAIKDFAVKSRAGILWTSHNMYEVEAICDRVLFLSHGRILLEGDPRVLPKEHGKVNLEELFIAVAREPLNFK